MTYEEFKEKFLPEFSKIRTFAGKIKYADQNLTRIGSGSGRAVYDIDGTKVLKVAKNPKGIAQNEIEAPLGNDYYTKDIVTEVFDNAEDDSWLIAEKAKKVSESRIKQLTGIPSLARLYQYLRYIYEQSVKPNKNYPTRLSQEELELFYENEFASGLGDLIGNYNHSYGDMGRPSTYGEVIRNGQPTIVLTDYGLSDEVYSQHYDSSRKKKYYMYELYQFADGNDDILSDIGNTGEVRHAMWAQVPYDVGDGDGVINEEFVHFVSNRDYYPEKPLETMPYLVENFHECINNLKEALSIAKDKKRFYNNLLKLQEYLVNQKWYNGERLGGIYENTQNKPINRNLDIKLANEVALEIAQIKGFNTPKFLGSGNFGVAYDIGGDRVLKITTDHTEANENMVLLGKPLKYIAKPFNVYKIESESGRVDDDTYAIILEKLETDVEKFTRLRKRLDYAFNKILDLSLADVLADYVADYISDGDMQKISAYLQKNPEDAEFFYSLIRIADEAKSYGVDSIDYINPRNLGYMKNGAIGFFDVGFGNAFISPNIPKMNVNEDGAAKFSQTDSIGRDDFPTYNQDNLPPDIENNLDANSANYVDERDMKYMPNSKSVEVKKKCRLGGLGNTSVACNQGDISNLNIKSLEENSIRFNETVWAWVSPDNRLIRVPKLNHKGYIMGVYKDYSWDYDKVFDKAIEDGWVRVIYEYFPERFKGSLSLNGYDKERVVSVFKSMFYDLVKYGGNSIYLEYENPKGYDAINTSDADGKRKLMNIIGENELIDEEIHADYAKEYNNAMQAMFDGKKDVSTIAFRIRPELRDVAINNDFGLIPVKQDRSNVDMNIVYRKTPRGEANAKRLYQIMMSHGGYAADQTPEEAREIGMLLDYTNDSINQYIQDRYKNKRDLDDLSENTEIKNNYYTSLINKKQAPLEYGDNYLFSVNFDEFVHFTTEENANKILNDRKIIGDSIWGVSLVYGSYFPEVQLTHIKGNNIVAVRFTTYKAPKIGYSEEVVWNNDVPLKTATIVSVKKAINLIDRNVGMHKLLNKQIKQNLRNNSDRYVLYVENAVLNEEFANEGVGDTYAEKNFGIEPEFADFEDKYNLAQTYKDRDKIVYNNGNIVIIKNPKSLENIGNSVRGIIDKNGNLYVEQNVKLIHNKLLKILDKLGLVKYVPEWQFNIPSEFITVHRFYNKNLMMLGDSNDMMIPDEYRNNYQKSEYPSYEQVKPIFDKFMSNAKKVNPNINFSDELIDGYVKYNTNEGIGDKYAEKFGVDPEFSEFEKQYASKQNVEREEVIYSDKEVTLIKNPKSLENIGSNVRGIVDKNGNLFVEQEVSIVHDEILELLNKLRLVKYIVGWHKKIPTEFITVQRYYDTNLFYLGESNEMMQPDDDRFEDHVAASYEESKPVFQQFIHRAKLKNPKIDFINDRLTVYQDYNESVEKTDNNFGLYSENTIFAENNLNDEMIKEAQIMSLGDLPFKDEVQSLGGGIYSVGGAVRDSFLGKESKDLDLLITGIPMDELEQILSRYGRVDMVGKSFGVLKFKPEGSTEDIDIAIPRTEKATGGGGHKDFEITSDHTLSIEDDLRRRDFTINAIAKDIDGNIIDPYNGRDDLKNKIIRVVNPDAFSDDPLRMLRGVQFASRFGFTIEPKTMEMIQKNAESIRKIPSERIVEEFKKIIEKGNPRVGVQLLVSTGLFKQIFGNEIKQSQIDRRDFESVKSMADFLFLMMEGVVQNPSQYYLTKFSTEDALRDKNYKLIKALEIAYDNNSNNPIVTRSIAHNMYVISPVSLESEILPEAIKIAANELLSGKYPKTVNELAVNGSDLMSLGLMGKEVGDMQRSLLLKVYGDKVRNDKNSLIAVAKGEEPKSSVVNEDDKVIDNNVLYSAVVLDDKSRSKLLKVVQPMIPDGWEIIAHHMTIKLGAINPENRGDLNDEVTLNVVDYAIDDMAFAVGVSGYPSNNKKPHITIAINRLEGAKPVMSNNLTNWKPLGFPLELKGVVTEIKRK